MSSENEHKLFHYVTKFFGLNPFAKKNSTRISVAAYGYTLFLAVLITIDFNFAYHKLMINEKIERAFFLISLMLKALDFILIMTSILKPLLFRRMRHEVQEGFKKANDMLQSHFQDQYDPAHSRVKVERRQLFLLILTGAPYHYVFYWAEEEGYLFRSTTTLLLHYVYYVKAILAFQVKKDMHAIRVQFEKVNLEMTKVAASIEVMENYAEPMYFGPEGDTSSEKSRNALAHKAFVNHEFKIGAANRIKEIVAIREKVLKLNGIHFEICQTFKKISLYYSYEALISTARITAVTVVPMYFIIIAFLVQNSGKRPRLGTLIFFIHFICANYYSLGSFIFSSTKTACEGNNISTIIHDILDAKVPPQIADELEMFSLQLIQRKVKFSILQLFNMTPSLLLSIAEQIATYVLILLQFHQNKNSHQQP